MINRILMELYDDYIDGNIDSLISFTSKTFPADGTDKLFIGCVLILFSQANGFKARYDVTRENLLAIVMSVKEKMGSSNLLEFYMRRINSRRGINKYLKYVLKDKNIDNYANTIIDYLENFKPKFLENLKQYNKKIEEYKNELNNN